ncbi:M16 family metallopeptidase [Amycolatopsis sp. NPDC054798]
MPSREIPVVSVVDERLRTASISLAVDYGGRHDPAERGGLAHYLEHLLMSLPVAGAGPLCEYVERRGGQANAETGLEHMLFHARVLAEDLDVALRSLVRAVAEPGYEPAVLESERTAVLQELTAAAADPLEVVQDAFLADLFPDHPLGRPVGGTEAEIQGMDLASVRAGHRSGLLSSQMTIAVVAPSSPGPLPAVDLTEVCVRKPVPLKSVAATKPRWPNGFAWVSVGGRSAARDDPRSYGFEVLAQLLGGSSASPLYRFLRGEKGLAYSFQAWNRGYLEVGAWRVLVGTDGENGAAVTEVVCEVLNRLAKDGPYESDLADARRRAVGEIVCATESPSEHARMLAERALVGGAGWTVAAELEAIRSVSVDDVREAAAEILDGLVVTVRPEAA